MRSLAAARISGERPKGPPMRKVMSLWPERARPSSLADSSYEEMSLPATSRMIR